MNQDSINQKEKVCKEKHENSRKHTLPQNSQDDFFEVIKGKELTGDTVAIQDKNRYYPKSHPESQDEKKQIFKCSWCTYETQKGNVSLTLHIGQAHRDKKIEKCSQCNYETYTSSRLNADVKTSHVYSTCPF